MAREGFDYLFKVVIVGDVEVGKTSITTQFAYGTFTEGYLSTIGVDFVVKSIPVNNHIVKLQAWDTGGQERYAAIRPLYYQGARGALLVFDITNRTSFWNLDRWLMELRRHAGPDVPILLVGNKLDLAEYREVSSDEARQYAARKGLPYFETSAKTAYGVYDVFHRLAQLMLARQLALKSDASGE